MAPGACSAVARRIDYNAGPPGTKLAMWTVFDD